MARRRALLVGAVALAAVMSGCASPEYTGIVRTPPPEVGIVELPEVSAGGSPTELRPHDGDLLAVYFGYTSCPDVCPTTLADFRQAVEEMGDDGDRVELAMVTIDPEVDSDEILTSYVQAFAPQGRAFRTSDHELLLSAAAPFGVGFEVIESADGGREVVHSAHLYLVDGDGRLLIQWPFGQSADDMAADMALALSS